MIRRIININEEKCTGCGLCVNACHEGAIDLIDGKARLTREHYCDGLGDCLPACPAGAISFEEREAPAYDEAAVLAAKAAKEAKEAKQASPSGCPGSQLHTLSPIASPSSSAPAASQLAQWPCQIKLLPAKAPFFQNAALLIAADCTAFAYANIHQDFMAGKVTLIGCPKLDNIDYSEKLTAILRENDIASLTVLRMQVPCCGGLEQAAKKAMLRSGKSLPLSVITVGINGNILA